MFIGFFQMPKSAGNIHYIFRHIKAIPFIEHYTLYEFFNFGLLFEIFLILGKNVQKLVKINIKKFKIP